MKLELIKAFSRRSRAVAAKKCTKKHDARAKLLFYQSIPIAFLPFSFTSLLLQPSREVLFEWSHRKILCTDLLMYKAKAEAPKLNPEGRQTDGSS